ncbi:AAA family ATPase [Acidithiobacillus sp.]
MSNQLTFSSIYKSITSLAAIDLPAFVVLTGRNGSGKTHLLEALRDGHVKSSLTGDHNTEVVLYDWNSIIPKDTGVFHTHQHLTQQSNWFTQIRASQDQAFPTLRQQVINLGIPPEYCSTLYKIRTLSRRHVVEFIPDEAVAEQAYNKIREFLKNHGRQVYSNSQRHIGDENWKKLAPEVVNDRPELFLETSESKFFGDKRFLWGEVDPFQQAFGRVFSTYRDIIHHNDRLEKYPLPEDDEQKFLDKSQFIAEYGIPPWDFVNQILETCNLDFRVNAPPMHEISSFEPNLKKLSSDVEMRFNDLSSGEKVLMSFALCLYNANDKRQKTKFPKLLLLDEVDSPLHPSMVVSLLNTIQTVLVDGEGISVILTTHSPSTVALAPEESLYKMNPAGPVIEKCSKGEALSILTTGVPTLSVSFDGRRQIFVESRTDANLYDLLYQRYKGHLDSERSLVFVEVGNTDNSGGERNAGCTQVTRLVGSLTTGGNQSVLGLVDWDGERRSIGRIHVLSPGVRDGLESLLFDPALMVVTIAGVNANYAKDNGILDSIDSYTSISNWDMARWQRAIDVIQNIVLGVSQSLRETISVEYINGMTLQVTKEYLHLDDHDLEEKVIRSFGFLKPKNSRAGGLMRHVVDTVLADYPLLLPRDLLHTLNRLLTEEIVT